MNILYTKPFTPEGETEALNFDTAKYFYFSGDLRLRSEYRVSVRRIKINKKYFRQYAIVSKINNDRNASIILDNYETADNWLVDGEKKSQTELEGILNELVPNAGGGGGGGGSVTVIDNLDSFSKTDALSANQGRVLKELIDDIDTEQVYKEYIDKALPFAQILLEPKTYTDISGVVDYDDSILTIANTLIEKSTGQLHEFENYTCSEPVAINGAKNVVITDIINTSDACAVAFYDNTTFISAPVGSAAYGDISTIEVPSGATHVRFCYYTQGGYTFSAKLLSDFTLLEDQLAFTNEDNEVVKVFTIIGPENMWSTTGNADTDPAINFIGTIDDKDFIIKNNGIEKMRFTSSPNSQNGNIYITDDPSRDDPYNYAKLSIMLTKANPVIYNYLCSYTENSVEKTSTIRMRIATTNGGGFTRAKVGDVILLKAGDGNLIIGTAATMISTSNPKSISIKPNNVTYPTADKANLGLNVKTFWDADKKMGLTYTGVNTDDPTDFLDIDSKIANDSGLTLTQLSPTSEVLKNAVPLGIDANNKVGIADLSSLNIQENKVYKNITGSTDFNYYENNIGIYNEQMYDTDLFILGVDGGHTLYEDNKTFIEERNLYLKYKKILTNNFKEGVVALRRHDSTISLYKVFVDADISPAIDSARYSASENKFYLLFTTKTSSDPSYITLIDKVLYKSTIKLDDSKFNQVLTSVDDLPSDAVNINITVLPE